jgi:hypothetical protein
LVARRWRGIFLKIFTASLYEVEISRGKKSETLTRRKRSNGVNKRPINIL